MKVLALLLIFISCQSNAGAATVTLTSTLDGSQTACPEEVVTYTCMVLRTSVASWHGLPDSIELDYFPSSPIGQQSVIGAFRATLTNRVLDPNNPFLADLTLTLIVTATAGRNGTVIECRGDEPSERMSLVLSVASLPPSPPQNPGYHVQHYGPHNVTVTVQWGYPEFDGGVPVDNYTISGTNIMTTTSQINETTLTLPYNVNQTIDVAATNCIGTNGTAMFTYFEAGCGEPTPPSRGFIDNFQSAAEGATITYSCSSGLVPGTQISAVCTNVTWKPDPSTLECREPISGELAPHSLQVQFINGSPVVKTKRVRADIVTNALTANLLCELLSREQLDSPIMTECSNGSATFSGIAPGKYRLRVVALSPGYNRSVLRRRVVIPNGPNFCTANLIDEGVLVSGSNLTVIFRGVGPVPEFQCILDRQRKFSCSSPVRVTGLSQGSHHFKILPQGCGRRSFTPLPFRFTIQ